MSDGEGAASDTSDTPPRWLDEIVETACALRELAGAEWQLLRAELRLARDAALLLVVVTIVAAATAMTLGLTLVALLGVGFAYWFGSWVLSLAALAVLLILVLIVALIAARLCLHWISLPATRAQWHSLLRRPVTPTRAPQTPGFDMETSDADADTQADQTSRTG